MYALRDKVSEKLSSLFADSRNQSSSPRLSISNSPEARLNPGAEKSFSSYFSFAPLSRNESSIPFPPIPIKHDSYDFEEIGTDGNGDLKDSNQAQILNEKVEQTINSLDIESNASANNVFPVKEMPDLTDDSVFISVGLYECLVSSLPNIVRGCKWVLLYSTVKHGISLRTLIRKSAELPGPCLLVAGDKSGAIFGAMVEGPFTPTPKRKYQGTSQSFLFTTIYGEPRIFRPTGANRYYWMCMNEFLAFGGGGNFALWMDGDLLKGTSGSSETFGNEGLANSLEFELKNVELWGFVHSSQYF